MSLIKLLSENLVNQIAAGEVVERPASVVKELVENSLDASADKIQIEIENGGKSYIKITDNGCGMSREDLEMSLQRHATSKINDEADLWKIRTMGFRGEALASISSVARVQIRTKGADDLAGWELACEGGDMKQLKEVGMSTGTQIEVNDLFFNTPARQKYLKKDGTELGRITSLINQLALANQEVAFKLVHNGKIIFDWAKKTDLISRIVDVLGVGVSEAMIPVFYGGSELQIDGFIGKPLLSRTTSQHQYIFVNGRAVQHHLLANRIKAAYHSMLMEHKKPIFVLNIKIDPSLIDVNVHPRKLEVRFEDQQNLIKIAYGCVKSALEKESLMPLGISQSRKYMSDSFPKTGSSTNPTKAFRSSTPSYTASPGLKSYSSSSPRASNPKQVQDAMNFNDSMFGERESSGVQETQETIDQSIIAISQVNNSYIIAKDKDGLVLIDQHAAHERVRYEELMKQFHSQKKSIQALLVPMQIELSGDEIALLEDNRDVFDALGFEITPFGGNTFVLNSVPTCLSNEDANVVLKGVLDDIMNNKVPTESQGKIEEMLTYMACRSAIKFGQKLSHDEMQGLITQMMEMKIPYTCPHGRPTMVALTMKELGKMFGRIG